MERRVQSHTRELAGATLIASTTGGYSVLAGDGSYLGYLHASPDGLVNTYQRVPGGLAQWLGKYSEENAVRAILAASGRTPVEAA